MTKVIAFEQKLRRKEVVKDPPVDADTILLRMYRERIDKIFCMDCITECKKRNASCIEPAQMSINDVSWKEERE